MLAFGAVGVVGIQFLGAGLATERGPRKLTPSAAVVGMAFWYLRGALSTKMRRFVIPDPLEGFKLVRGHVRVFEPGHGQGRVTVLAMKLQDSLFL